MYQPKANNEGLTLENNRVALPAVHDFTEVYADLPFGMWPGFKADLDDRVHAVLCKNAATALAVNIVIQRRASTYHTDTIYDGTDAFFDAEKGENVIYIVEASVTADAWKNRKVYIRGHPFPYTIRDNDASATVKTVANVVKITLGQPLIKAADRATPLTTQLNIFENVVIGTTDTAKAIGLTFATVPANNYFWAVYYGRVLKTATAAAGDHIIKAASGAFAKLTLAGSAEDFDAEILGIHEGANITFLDISGIAA